MFVYNFYCLLFSPCCFTFVTTFLYFAMFSLLLYCLCWTCCSFFIVFGRTSALILFINLYTYVFVFVLFMPHIIDYSCVSFVAQSLSPQCDLFHFPQPTLIAFASSLALPASLVDFRLLTCSFIVAFVKTFTLHSMKAGVCGQRIMSHHIWLPLSLSLCVNFRLNAHK